MLKDRLQELATKRLSWVAEVQDVEVAPQHEGLVVFLDKVSRVQTDLKKIKDILKSLQTAFSMCITTARQDYILVLEKDIDNLQKKYDRLFNKTSSTLQVLENIFLDSVNPRRHPALYRIYKNHVEHIHEHLSFAKLEYIKISSEYEQNKKKRQHRRRQILQNQVSVDELVQLLEKESAVKLVKNSILLEEEDLTLPSKLRLDARDQELDSLMYIETKLQETHDLFAAANALVHEQRETMDNIEKNILRALSFVDEAAHEHLPTIRYKKRKHRKRKFAAILSVLATIATLVTALVICLG